MNASLPACKSCQQEFWPGSNEDADHCPKCSGAAVAPATGRVTLPPRKKTVLPKPSHLSGNAVSVRPRELPGNPLPDKSSADASLENVRGKRSPQIMFSCPSCMTMLALKPGFQISGHALPCPYCATAIVPPQLFIPKGTPKKRKSNVWKVGEQKDRNKIYRPPRDNANHVFLKAKA